MVTLVTFSDFVAEGSHILGCGLAATGTLTWPPYQSASCGNFVVRLGVLEDHGERYWVFHSSGAGGEVELEH